MQDAFAYCAQLVREADKDRFLAAMFAPAAHRDCLLALYAFDVEIARIATRISGPMPGEIRLQWWREVIEGRRAAEAAGNPVALAVGAAIVRYRLPTAAFDEILSARAIEFYDDPFASVAGLDAHLERTTSDVIGLAAMILNEGADPGPAALFRHAGLALGIATLLRNLPQQVALRRLLIPLELMERYGAEPADVMAGRIAPELRAALAELRLRARRHLTEARSLLPQASPAIGPALLPLVLVRPLLARMEGRRYDPLNPPRLPQWRRQWLLWRAARGGLVRALR